MLKSQFHSLTPERYTGLRANVDILYSGTEAMEWGSLFTWFGNKQHSYKYVFSTINPETKGLCYFAETATFKTIKQCVWVSPLGT